MRGGRCAVGEPWPIRWAQDMAAALDATGCPDGTPAERIERLASDRDSWMLAATAATEQVEELRARLGDDSDLADIAIRAADLASQETERLRAEVARCCGCPLSITAEGKAIITELESAIDDDRWSEAEALIAKATEMLPEGHPDITRLTNLVELSRALEGEDGWAKCQQCVELGAEVERLRNKLLEHGIRP